MFEPVPKAFDVPALEREVLKFWEENEIERLYLEKNRDSPERFRFLDGPITANGPMGVHHAWGRTYKDLWQRYNTMLGKRQRYQNGFDCQGLWVEVVAERELGFTNKRDIETYGIANFVRKCKEDVYYFADMQTRQSRRLGYFMDWAYSYYTLSDQNNYTIWHFLKTCHERGLLYRGHDVMPWCTRCGTGISDAEAAEGYQDLTHTSVYVKFPLAGRPGESLLVWTTTPWTLTSNVAVAVNPELTYVKVRQGNEMFYLAEGALPVIEGEREVLAEMAGSDLLGWSYSGPFDDLPAVAGTQHVAIPWDEVSEDEGTGIVHIAPGAGKEDFALSKEYNLPVIAPINQDGVYTDGFGRLTGLYVQDVADDIIQELEKKDLLYRSHQYRHRYPTCWRCGTELVFRLVDEWFISMHPLREPMAEIVRNIRWIPAFGLERELDWLRNMGDWMISKKRYWGLALPFWVCSSDHLQVIGSRQELDSKAIGGPPQLESPHRPWIDAVELPCPKCGGVARRIADVGNPWLDAGIVPYSTLGYNEDREYWREWFPAEFITESFPGQFRNWFYSMLAMSTVLGNTEPFQTVLGYALLRDEMGREMHKSWGNTIPFDEAADRAGADMMRWLFCQHNPEQNLNFGFGALDEVKRRLLILWHTYSFLVMYATVDGWTPDASAPPAPDRPLLDRWVLARLNETIGDVKTGLDRFDAAAPAHGIERFIEELSTWYVRRSRRRFWKAESDEDKLAAYATLYECLTTLARLLAPFMPFVAESLYQNLVRTQDTAAPLSVHLTDYPKPDNSVIDRDLLEAMVVAQQVVSLGRAAREKANLHVRQPLARLFVRVPSSGAADAVARVEDIILDELNVRALEFAGEDDAFVEYSVRPNLPVLGPKYGRRLPQIKAALDSSDPEQLALAVMRGDRVTLRVSDGERVELLPDEVLVTANERPGYAAMSSDGYLAALDTELNDDLIAEGMARTVVRYVNNWRREADLNLDDRIDVGYEATPRLAAAIVRFAEYIANETLATRFEAESLDDLRFVRADKIGDETLRIRLQRSTS
jgi:isoleucyl-tRNA synthetase